jgi:hypothetical protein
MRRLILGTMAAVAMALGVSAGAFAAPAFRPYDGHPNVVNVQRADYYWNHHSYHHRDWDQHQHRWHYYD